MMQLSFLVTVSCWNQKNKLKGREPRDWVLCFPEPGSSSLCYSCRGGPPLRKRDQPLIPEASLGHAPPLVFSTHKWFCLLSPGEAGELLSIFHREDPRPEGEAWPKDTPEQRKPGVDKKLIILPIGPAHSRKPPGMCGGGRQTLSACLHPASHRLPLAQLLVSLQAWGLTARGMPS